MPLARSQFVELAQLISQVAFGLAVDQLWLAEHLRARSLRPFRDDIVLGVSAAPIGSATGRQVLQVLRRAGRFAGLK